MPNEDQTNGEQPLGGYLGGILRVTFLSSSEKIFVGYFELHA